VKDVLKFESDEELNDWLVEENGVEIQGENMICK
jgi:hypothetical protein